MQSRNPHPIYGLVNLSTLRKKLDRFRLFPFRSPLLREYCRPCGRLTFFLFLELLRCFSSLGALHMLYIFKHGYHGISAMVGYPIRTSPDQRLVATSPKLIAGSDVLHRSLVSRHPPYALCVLTFRRDTITYSHTKVCAMRNYYSSVVCDQNHQRRWQF